jgi:hypothetical protein
MAIAAITLQFHAAPHPPPCMVPPQSKNPRRLLATGVF